MVSDIELAEQWIAETCKQIRALVFSMPKELGVTGIEIGDTHVYVHGTDENGEYVILRLYSQGYEGIFFDERFYPDREGEEDGTTD